MLDLIIISGLAVIILLYYVQKNFHNLTPHTMTTKKFLTEITDLLQDKDYQQKTNKKTAMEYLEKFLSDNPFLGTKGNMDSEEFLSMYKGTRGTSLVPRRGYNNFAWILKEEGNLSIMLCTGVKGFYFVYDTESKNPTAKPFTKLLSRKNERYKNLEKQTHFFYYMQKNMNSIMDNIRKD